MLDKILKCFVFSQIPGGLITNNAQVTDNGIRVFIASYGLLNELHFFCNFLSTWIKCNTNQEAK